MIFRNNKIRAIILLTIAFCITISLISYNPSDPSFNVTTDGYPNNILSYLGSYLSDLLYQLVGLAAFIMPLPMFIWSYKLFWNGTIKWPFIKCVLMLISVCFTACALNFYHLLNWLPSYTGGIIGFGLVYIVQKINYITQYQAYFIYFFSCLALFSLSLATGIHFKTYVNILSSVMRFFGACLKKLRIFKFSISYKDNETYHDSGEFGYLMSNNNVPTVTTETVMEQRKPSPIINKNLKIPTPTLYEDLIPSIDLLADGNNQNFRPQTSQELNEKSEQLLKVLGDFGVKGKIIDVKEGPVVTMYELEPAAGTKSSRVVGLADDIARSLSAVSTRIAVIPGRNALGIELPNKQRMFFCLKELVQTQEFQNSSILLPLILGKDLTGAPMIADLAKMPHLLVAGTTGSGKSVAINAMIMSLLYKYTPKECRMIMIDPKMLELSAYDNIPHLMTPVVTEPGKAVVALKWAVKEMENRYRLMSHLGVRNLASYNDKIQEAVKNGQTLERKIQTGFDPETGKPIYDTIPIDMNKMPLIVVIVDEMADLMLVAGKDIETSIQRLAQMARASGIHIIMATQRPSVDVITGVIKANFPSRISFKVTSKIDSRTILGEQGAEQLLGMGDMLFMGSSSRILRVHGPFVDDSEVEKVTNFLRSTGTPEYVSAVTESVEDELSVEFESQSPDNDLYTQAVNIVRTERKTSISYIQRCLRIGYNRAANLVEEMEKNGVLSVPNHSGKREVLLPED